MMHPSVPFSTCTVRNELVLPRQQGRLLHLRFEIPLQPQHADAAGSA
jgi:hypothetical protein